MNMTLVHIAAGRPSEALATVGAEADPTQRPAPVPLVMRFLDGAIA
jgi:hypothetical protein